MSTNPQLRAYVENDHDSQKERVRRYVEHHEDQDVNEIAKGLNLPPGRVTARLNDLQKEGEVVGQEPSKGNTTYYVPESESLKRIKAAQYSRKNHWVTKFFHKANKTGHMTDELKNELLQLFYAVQ